MTSTLEMNTTVGDRRWFRAAIIGTSTAGPSWHHARGLLKHARAELVGVADIDRARAAEFAEEHGGGCHSYPSLTRLLESERVVDVVFVCVPDEYHAAVAIEAMEAGAHVVCEKPPAGSVAEVTEMLRVAEERNLTVYWAFPYQHMLQVVTPFLDRAEIGPVHIASGHWDRRRGAPTWRPGADPMFDLGGHLVPALWTSMGRPKPLRVSAMQYNVFGADPKVNLIGPARPYDTPDVAQAVIDFVDGELRPRMLVTVSYMGNHPAEEAIGLQFQGRNTGISVPLVAGALDPRIAIPTISQEKLGRLLTTQIDRPVPLSVQEGFDAQTNHVIACLDGQSEPLITGADALVVQRILDGFKESAARGGDFVDLTD